MSVTTPYRLSRFMITPVHVVVAERFATRAPVVLSNAPAAADAAVAGVSIFESPFCSWMFFRHAVISSGDRPYRNPTQNSIIVSRLVHATVARREEAETHLLLEEVDALRERERPHGWVQQKRLAALEERAVVRHLRLLNSSCLHFCKKR